jgi:hypothetical protein
MSDSQTPTINDTNVKRSKNGSRVGRNRSNTARSYTDRRHSETEEDERGPPSRGIITPIGSSRGPSPRRERDTPDLGINTRPTFNRAATSDSTNERDYSPIGAKLSRAPTEPTAILAANRLALRPAGHRDQIEQERDEQRYFNGRSDSPTSLNSAPSRSTSWSTVDTSIGGSKKIPPPPPSRAKKPAPPAPPMKRSALSTSQIPYSPH